MKLVNTADLKSAPLRVAGSSPAASILLITLKIKERWLSGQRHLTVNQTTFVYVGSNPTLSMTNLSPFRLVVRTLPFRGKGTGSIPVRGIPVLMKIMTERSAVW